MGGGARMGRGARMGEGAYQRTAVLPRAESTKGGHGTGCEDGTGCVPENCSVAPSRESTKLPMKPAAAPTMRRGHWGGLALRVAAGWQTMMGR